MNTVRTIARLLIAPVFIFSGFVKAIDPLGFTYKLSDYFDAFGLSFFTPVAFALSIFVCTTELVIGLNLLLGNLMRVTSWVLLIFMSFFTILTFIVALTNPVTDCGCFGDAIILTNWQTFWKNIILLPPALIVFFNRKKYRPICQLPGEWGVTFVFYAVVIFISVFNYRNLPAIDFRPYKIGTNIPSAMIIPDDAEKAEIESKFIYEKNGAKKEFSISEIPYQDTAWKYVDRIDKIIKKGYEPPIHDFSLTSADGIDITDSVLSNEYSLLVIAHNLNKSDINGLKKVNSFAEKMKKSSIPVYCMTASSFNDIKRLDNIYKFNFDFFTCDEIALKTMIRSNPGVILLNEGTVINMWHYRNLPDISDKTTILTMSLSDVQQSKKAYIIGFYLVLLISLSFALILITRIKNKIY